MPILDVKDLLIDVYNPDWGTDPDQKAKDKRWAILRLDAALARYPSWRSFI